LPDVHVFVRAAAVERLVIHAQNHVAERDGVEAERRRQARYETTERPVGDFDDSGAREDCRADRACQCREHEPDNCCGQGPYAAKRRENHAPQDVRARRVSCDTR
jgi:hypothetical protein